MIYVIFVCTLYYLISFFLSIRKRGFLHPYSILLILVSIIGICSLITDIESYTFLVIENHSQFYYLLFFLLWFIIIQPFKNVVPITNFKFNVKYFRLLFNITGVLSFFPFFYLLSYSLEGILSGAATVRYNLYIYKDYILPDSIFTTISAGLSMFYPLIMIFYFISDKIKFLNIIKIGVFLGAFINPILLALSFMERDIFIFLPTMILFLLYMRGKSIHLTLKNTLLIILFVFLGVLMSLSRFGEDGIDRVIFGTIGYLGQQPFVFADILANHIDFYGFSLRLPIIAEFLGNYKEIIRANPREWHFGSIFADFFMMYSWNSLFIGFLLLLIITKSFNPKKINSFSTFYFITLIFQILSQGIFYFNLGNFSGNQFLIISFMLILIFKITKL